MQCTTQKHTPKTWSFNHFSSDPFFKVQHTDIALRAKLDTDTPNLPFHLITLKMNKADIGNEIRRHKQDTYDDPNHYFCSYVFLFHSFFLTVKMRLSGTPSLWHMLHKLFAGGFSSDLD